MDLSITIASYNSHDVTQRALESIFEKTLGIEFEVIAVDNASIDGSADMIERCFPKVRLVRSNRNLGFAAAHNRALLMAQGRFFLLLNSDVLFLDNAAKKMLDRLRNEPEQVGAVGPQILHPDGSLAPSSRRHIFYSRTMVGLSAINQYFPFGNLLPTDFLRRRIGRLLGKFHDNFDPPASKQEVEWLDGVCVMFKRESLEQVGLFDEEFFFDYEIGDLLVRVRRAGWRIIFDPDVKIVHLDGYSRKQTPQIRVDSQRSQLIYYTKHKPEYIPFMRSVVLTLIGLKLRLLKLEQILSADRECLRERLQILEETRRFYINFEPTSVRENVRIPRLLFTSEHVSENSERDAQG